jgi:hypothetical protein
VFFKCSHIFDCVLIHKDILTNGSSTMLSRRFLRAWDPDCNETRTEAPGRSELTCLKFLWNSIGQFFFKSHDFSGSRGGIVCLVIYT